MGIQLRRVTRIYRPSGKHSSDLDIHALRGVSLDVADGELVAIMGPSGSGKSTLMNILGCLDVASSGTYYLDHQDVAHLTDKQRAAIRSRKIGFVFQQYNLLPRATAAEQVELPLVYAGVDGRRKRALAALDAVGLSHRANSRPNELSGGQQQRVAIARALVTRPSIILADEPTGALDTRTSIEVIATFQRLNREHHLTVIFVTHEQEVAYHTRRVICIRDGRIQSDASVPKSIFRDAECEQDGRQICLVGVQ
jgi:putative ABC transport system ATP-binding protein